MIQGALLVGFLAFLPFVDNTRDSGIGTAPEPGVASRDLTLTFKLPPLHNEAGGEIEKRLAGLQMGKRAAQLGLNPRSATIAWTTARTTLQTARARLAAGPPESPREFAGASVSELNALIRDMAVRGIKVTSPALRVDEALAIRRGNLWLDLGRAELRAGDKAPRFLLQVENASEVVVNGGAFLGGENAVLVSGGRNVTLRHGRCEGQRRDGVVFTNAPGAILAHTFLTRIGGAPALVHGDTDGATLLDNEITGNLGSSNWNAGIVISDRNGDVAQDPANILSPDYYGPVEQPIQTRLHPPRNTLIAFNHVTLNASSGIYGDGSVEGVIFGNLVEANAKEGVCLDNGSTSNVLAMNIISLNGKRWGKTDAELRLDFVADLKRLPDGSSPAKTPALSLDNSLYNLVYANQIERNYGGGIKMVRTAYCNIVGMNTVVDNNEGVNELFHFFGIELGAAKADAPVSDLDFTPSQGNIIFGNIIRGPHYAGIFLGLDSTRNDLFDNTIFGATNWAIEQAKVQENSSLNNLTNLPSRNIDAGIDPNLLKVTRGRND